MRRITFLFALLCAIYCRAQNFDYQFSTTSSNYAELSGATTVASSANWINSFIKVPIGFTFSYLGNGFDSVAIYNNGYLVFDRNSNYGFAAFGFNLAIQNDSSGNSVSSISYKMEGNTGSRIFKIQFKNCGVNAMRGGTVSYQIWLAESNLSCTLISGGTSYSGEDIASAAKIVGLINMNSLHDGQAALLLNGAASSPAASVVNSAEARKKIIGFPETNTVYTFTPNF